MNERAVAVSVGTDTALRLREHIRAHPPSVPSVFALPTYCTSMPPVRVVRSSLAACTRYATVLRPSRPTCVRPEGPIEPPHRIAVHLGRYRALALEHAATENDRSVAASLRRRGVSPYAAEFEPCRRVRAARRARRRVTMPQVRRR